MPIKISEDLIDRAIKLRVEEKLSIDSISKQLNISQGTCSKYLKNYPLSLERIDELNHQRKRTMNLSENKFGLEKSKYLKLRDGSNFTTNQKGNIAELAVRLRLEILGFETFYGALDGVKFDGIIKIDGELKTYQVRWAAKDKHSRNCSIRLKKSDGRKKQKSYQKEDFDFIFAYEYITDSVYIYTWDDINENVASLSMKEDALEAWNKLK